MQISEFSQALFYILKDGARLESSRLFHTFTESPHLFLATLNVLNANKKKDEKLNDIYTNLREILNKYGVTGETFRESFLTYCPEGQPPQSGEKFEITPGREYSTIYKNLRRRFVAEKRTMDIEDLILELFADSNYMVSLIFADITKSETKAEELRNELIKKFKKKIQKDIKELEGLGELTNLNKWVVKNPQKVVDSDEPVMKIEMALSGRSIKNCIITGPAGTGKTTYVYEFVQRIVSGDCPEQFADKVVYQVDPTALIAGTRFRGDFEEKLMNILETVKTHPNVILFIDELHSLVNLGAGSDGAQSAGNMLKPYITRGEVQIIGCTTAEEYTKHILPDKAFASRFHEVKIDEPTKSATKQILQGILPVETEFFNKRIQEELVDKVIDLSDRYALDQANPRKAINMLELACAYCKVFEEKKEKVDVDDVINSVKLRYNIYISKNKVVDTKNSLFKTLLGQDEALNQVIRNLQIVDAEITDPQRPSLSMLLCGPTGTGKTETCKIIAKNFYGSDENLVKINMGEYSSEMDVSKLTGSSAGYIGYDDEPQLIKEVRQHPNSVILFDEVEKAHPSIQKVLLNILDTGEMRDNKGNRISFRNNIIVFTTNLGCTHETGKATGMGFVQTTVGSGKNDILKAIKDYFSPEFLGRLDDIVYYQSLSKNVLTTLVNRYIDEYKSRSTKDGVKNLVISDDDIQDIFKEANVETQGARGVRKAVQKKLAMLYTKQTEEPVAVS